MSISFFPLWEVQERRSKVKQLKFWKWGETIYLMRAFRRCSEHWLLSEEWACIKMKGRLSNVSFSCSLRRAWNATVGISHLFSISSCMSSLHCSSPLSSPPCWGIQQILISLLALVLQPGLQPHKGQGFKLNVRTTSSPDPHLHMNNHKEMMELKEGYLQMREWKNTEQSVPVIF